MKGKDPLNKKASRPEDLKESEPKTKAEPRKTEK
jgi:hypothetical protein